MENLLAAQKPFSAPPPNCNTSLDTLNLERLLSNLPTRSTTLRAERGSSPSGMTLARFPCSPIAATESKLVESAKDAGSGNSIMKPMKPPQKPWTSRTGKHNSAGPVLDQTTVRPQGSYGFGILTAHPVGLLVVAAVILIVVTGIPATRLFFVGSVAVGVIFGFCLWLYHRRI